MTLAELRDRLTEMRGELLAELARGGIEPGHLLLMAGIAATLDALHHAAGRPPPSFGPQPSENSR